MSQNILVQSCVSFIMVHHIYCPTFQMFHPQHLRHCFVIAQFMLKFCCHFKDRLFNIVSGPEDSFDGWGLWGCRCIARSGSSTLVLFLGLDIFYDGSQLLVTVLALMHQLRCLCCCSKSFPNFWLFTVVGGVNVLSSLLQRQLSIKAQNTGGNSHKPKQHRWDDCDEKLLPLN